MNAEKKYEDAMCTKK